MPEMMSLSLDNSSFMQLGASVFVTAKLGHSRPTSDTLSPLLCRSSDKGNRSLICTLLTTRCVLVDCQLNNYPLCYSENKTYTIIIIHMHAHSWKSLRRLLDVASPSTTTTPPMSVLWTTCPSTESSWDWNWTSLSLGNPLSLLVRRNL